MTDEQSSPMDDVETAHSMQGIGQTLANIFMGALNESGSILVAFWSTVSFAKALQMQVDEVNEND